MRFLFMIFVGLFVVACKDSQVPSQKYSYNAPSKQYAFEVGKSFLHIKLDSKPIQKGVLLMFVGEECANCQMYYEHFNNLAKSYQEVQILGVLQSPTSNEDIEHFITKHHIEFEVIAPQNPINMPQIIVQSKQNLNNQNLNDENASLSQESQDYQKLELPYFVLYDTKGDFYQDYWGIIPEEIFASDITQMLD